MGLHRDALKAVYKGKLSTPRRTSQKRKLIVHLDVIVMETVSVIGQGQRIERGVEVRNENLEARDMMVRLYIQYVNQS